MRLANGMGPAPLVLSDGSIYSFGGLNVMKAPVEGGDATALASCPGNVYPEGIAVDGASVCWTEDDMVLKASTDGGDATTLISGQPSPWAIAVAPCPCGMCHSRCARLR